ncbi:hypothetical protein CPB86DRAFT_450157 [Serendipita vermifera]|nr:hypothetical protein CPB86DRAFT_450157 [Serendipita vermifera]
MMIDFYLPVSGSARSKLWPLSWPVYTGIVQRAQRSQNGIICRISLAKGEPVFVSKRYVGFHRRGGSRTCPAGSYVSKQVLQIDEASRGKEWVQTARVSDKATLPQEVQSGQVGPGMEDNKGSGRTSCVFISRVKGDPECIEVARRSHDFVSTRRGGGVK